MAKKFYIVSTCILLMIVVMLVTRSATYAGTPVPKQIVAQEFDLVDNRGVKIGELSSSHGEPLFTLTNTKNGHTTSVQLGTLGGTATVVCTSSQKDRVNMTALNARGGSPSSLMVFTANGQSKVLRTTTFDVDGNIASHVSTGPHKKLAQFLAIIAQHAGLR